MNTTEIVAVQQKTLTYFAAISRVTQLRLFHPPGDRGRTYDGEVADAHRTPIIGTWR